MKSSSSSSNNPGGSLLASSSSTWQSPVPYVFGGLAAMLGLIAFGLLILACSYRNRRYSGQNTDLESGGEKELKSAKPNYDHKVLVIMAGQHKPTYVATPLSVSPGTRNDCQKEEDEITETNGQPCPNYDRKYSTGVFREPQFGAF